MRVQRRTATAALAAAGLAMATVAAGPASASNPNSAEKMAQAVTVEAVNAHLEEFQAIADANDGNRAAGTFGYDASAEYVMDVLSEAGYEPQKQEFEFAYFAENAPAQLQQLSPDATTYQTGTFTYSGSGDVSAPVQAVDINVTGDRASSSGCEAADFAGFTEGNIALIQRGTCSFGVKAANADAAGASAVIIFNQGNDPTREELIVGTLGGIVTDIPVVGASFADGVDLSDPAGTVARVVTDTMSETRTTFNVIAETRTGRADNVVMMGAHLDSVSEGPGINDNGTGSAGILETAVQLAKVNKLNNKVRFAWWSAEELGLLGSEHYVGALTEGELDAIATYLNFDMIGSPNYQIGVYDADESTYEAPVDVPGGSIETEDVLTDWFDKTGQPWVDTEFSGRSDYQAFILAGVPASGLFTGAEEPKTAEEEALFGGEAGVAYDVNYHAVGDTIDNVNLEALDINADAIAAAAITLAQSTQAINGARSAGTSGQPHPVEDHLHEPAA